MQLFIEQFINCNDIIDIDDSNINLEFIKLNNYIEKIKNIDIKDTNIVLVGICSKCREGKMPRPVKYRSVERLPQYTYFIPVGRKKCEIKDVVIKVEELEAMRLKDIEKLNQEECAERMHVSRQTFQNIIDSAREKTALALTQGNSIRINGGNYRPVFCKFKCFNCGNIYEIKKEEDKYVCPSCGSNKVICNKRANLCKKWCKLGRKDD